jgi:L-serine kinase (ADP)
MTDNIIFINPRELLWHERVKLRHVVGILLKMILFRRFDAPIIIDSKTKTILDGHHRCYVANRLGLKKVPCYPVN